MMYTAVGGLEVGSGCVLLEAREVKRVAGERTVLSGVSFSLNENEVLLVRGPSGVGKSMLLRAIAGLDSIQVSLLIPRDQCCVDEVMTSLGFSSLSLPDLQLTASPAGW
jgi:ABC-type transport system involved in cytochrome c biogenesis ATPase subunit